MAGLLPRGEEWNLEQIASRQELRLVHILGIEYPIGNSAIVLVFDHPRRGSEGSGGSNVIVVCRALVGGENSS